MPCNLTTTTKDNELVRETVSGMLFFELTEVSHILLKKAIHAYSSILHLAGYRKDPVALAMDLEEIETNRNKALEILRISRFSSLKEMEFITQTYTDMVKDIYRETIF